MTPKTRDKMTTWIANTFTVAVFVVVCIGVVWIFKGPTPQEAPSTITYEELFIIEKYIDDLETLNNINKELIEVYELRLLQCEGDLHSS